MRRNKVNIEIILTCVAFALLSVFITPIDADTLFHIKTGEQIYLSRSIPLIDSFSIFNGNVHQHEWLSDIILYMNYHSMGMWGIQLISFASAFLSYYLIFKYLSDKSKINDSFYIVTISFLLIFEGNYFNGRPQIFSLPIFICIVILLLDYADNGKKKGLILIPPLSVLFANFHGGAASQIIVLLILFFGITIEDRFVNKRGSVIDYNILAIVPVAFACTLINPFGIGIYEYAVKIMANPYTKYIQEWGAFTFEKDMLSLITFLFLIGPYLLIAFTKCKIDLYRIGIYTFYLFSTLASRRMCFQTAIIGVLCFYPILGALAADYWQKFFKQIYLWCLITIYLISGFNNFYSYFKNQDLLFAGYPEKCVEYIKEQNIDVTQERLLNDYGDGGYLIFKNIKVFIDGRQDPYLKEFGNRPVFDDYVKNIILAKGEKSIKQFVERYRCKYILTAKTSKIAYYLENHPDEWKIVCSDKQKYLFKKAIDIT